MAAVGRGSFPRRPARADTTKKTKQKKQEAVAAWSAPPSDAIKCDGHPFGKSLVTADQSAVQLCGVCERDRERGRGRERETEGGRERG